MNHTGVRSRVRAREFRLPECVQPGTLWRAVLWVALAAYWLAGTYQLHLPGLNYDEALDAVPAMNVVLNQPLDSTATLQVGGRQWPWMTMTYIGPTTSYLLMLPFKLAGVSVLTLRLTTLAVGGLALLLAWGFLRELFDERLAGLAVLFLALDPTYIFWSRMGAWIAQPMLPLCLAALWCLWRWYRRAKPHALILAGLFLGLGLTTKLLFVWVWGALAVAWLLLTPWIERSVGWRRWLWPVRRAAPGTWALATVAALLGSSVVLWYNLRSARSLDYFQNVVLTPESAQFRGLATVIEYIKAGLDGFAMLLNGSWFGADLGGPHTNLVAVPAFVVAVGMLFWLAATHRLRYSPKRVAFVAIFLACLFAESTLTRTGQGSHHMILLWPFPQTLVALALIGAADAVKTVTGDRQAQIWPQRAPQVIGILALVVVGAEGWTTYRYHRTLAQTGGVGLFSDAIYDLARDLQQPGTPKAVALDWGFRRNLQLLSENRLNPREWFTHSSPPLPEFNDYLENLVQEPATLYIFHTPEYAAYPGHWDVFERTAFRHRLTPVLWKGYSQRNGTPVYEVYKLEAAPTLTALPAGVQPVDVHLGDDLSLLGYDQPVTGLRAGETLEVTAYWQAVAAPARSYKVFATLVDAGGRQWAAHDSIPVDWGYPTTQWQAGEIVADRMWLPVDPEAPAGTYQLFVGMYDPETGQRLPLRRDGERLQGDTVELLQVQVTR